MKSDEIDALLARLDGYIPVDRPIAEIMPMALDVAEAAALIRSQVADIAVLRDWKPEGNILDIINRAERAESELAALKHDLAQYQARDAERETRIAELERAWSRNEWQR